jgi:hypothetical protein
MLSYYQNLNFTFRYFEEMKEKMERIKKNIKDKEGLDKARTESYL